MAVFPECKKEEKIQYFGKMSTIKNLLNPIINCVNFKGIRDEKVSLFNRKLKNS